MTYSSFKLIPKCNIPRDVTSVDINNLPEVVKDNIPYIKDCNVYLTIASWDNSYMYTAFNKISHTASRVVLFDIIH
jgi:hypothetical protein